MSNHNPETSVIEHPAIIAIAMDIMFAPSHRSHYSELVLTLADKAIERIKAVLVEKEGSENSCTVSETSAPL